MGKMIINTEEIVPLECYQVDALYEYLNNKKN